MVIEKVGKLIKLLEKNSLEQILEINNLREKLDKQQQTIDSIKTNEISVYQNVLLPEDELNKKFNEFVNEGKKIDENLKKELLYKIEDDIINAMKKGISYEEMSDFLDQTMSVKYEFED